MAKVILDSDGMGAATVRGPGVQASRGKLARPPPYNSGMSNDIVIVSVDADNLTRSNTAFRTYADLTAACRAGYVPTLNNRQDGPAALAAMLRADGFRTWSPR